MTIASTEAVLDRLPSRSFVAGVRAIVETTKPGITRMVVITAVVGFVAAAMSWTWRGGPWLLPLVWCIVGTALSSSGANSLNQWWERARDARMARTARRPLPRGAVSPQAVLWAGLILSILGVAVLAFGNGPAPAAVSLACILSYVLVYTPLKPVTSLSTLVGAVPGALPPLIGWTAAAGGWDSLMMGGGWSLFVLMFVWQLPHFLAIAWMYREDYRLGGYPVLPVLDPSGAATSGAMLCTAVILLPATLMPLITMERLGVVYAAAATATWFGYMALSVKLAKRRTRDAARNVFLASIAHLPLLLVVLVLDLAWL